MPVTWKPKQSKPCMSMVDMKSLISELHGREKKIPITRKSQLRKASYMYHGFNPITIASNRKEKGQKVHQRRKDAIVLRETPRTPLQLVWMPLMEGYGSSEKGHPMSINIAGSGWAEGASRCRLTEQAKRFRLLHSNVILKKTFSSNHERRMSSVSATHRGWTWLVLSTPPALVHTSAFTCFVTLQGHTHCKTRQNQRFYYHLTILID